MPKTLAEAQALIQRADDWINTHIIALEKTYPPGERPPGLRPRTAHREAILEDEALCRAIETRLEKRRRHWRFFYEPTADGRWIATYFLHRGGYKTADQRETERIYKRNWRKKPGNRARERQLERKRGKNVPST